MSHAIDPTHDYTPVTLEPRRNGWTAERQRVFLSTLAETGRVAVAAEAVGLSPRSAYRLRRHPKGHAFAAAWDRALDGGASRLNAAATARAAVGGVGERWRDDTPLAAVSLSSVQLLNVLRCHLAGHISQKKPMPRGGNTMHPAERDFAAYLAALGDVDLPAGMRTAPYHCPHPPAMSDTGYGREQGFSG